MDTGVRAPIKLKGVGKNSDLLKRRFSQARKHTLNTRLEEVFWWLVVGKEGVAADFSPQLFLLGWFGNDSLGDTFNNFDNK